MNRGRTFTFGELAEEAADRSPPANPPLRGATKGRLMGQPLPRLDGPAKADGSWRFAGDVRLPDTLFASVRIAPPGGRLKGFARDAITAVPGIRHVAARDGWLAVVAETWWAAERGIEAAEPKFTGARTDPDIRHAFEQALATTNSEEWFSRGDYDFDRSRIAAARRDLLCRTIAAPGAGAAERHSAREGRGYRGLGRDAGARLLAADSVSLYPLPPASPRGVRWSRTRFRSPSSSRAS